jgi:hypothetical protein
MTVYPGCRVQGKLRRVGHRWPAGGKVLTRILYVGLPAFVLLIAVSCSPTVKVEAPTEPITINLNIKLDADVRLRVEEKAKEDVKTKSIF